MLYGEFSIRPLIERDVSSLHLLKNVMTWEGCSHHKVNYENFSGGFFLDPRLPYSADDFLYIDTIYDVLVLMAGSIYNRAELGHTFNIDTDTLSEPAFVAHLYLLQGPDFVNNLNGDFSIIIYQSRKNAVYLFRDHVGVAPLAYTTTEESVYFSSDIIALCRTFHKGGRINMDPLIGDYKTIDNTLTPNDKVLKLKAGHFLKFSAEGITSRKYWAPEQVQTDKSLTQERMFSDLKSLLSNTVHIRSDQRFKAGAHVSGGLDSSIVAALARKEYANQPAFRGYSWSPSNASPKKNELDERELVKQTCEMAGIKPKFIQVEVKDFVQLVKNSMNSFMYFLEEKVLRMANGHKINLLFSGWGGDEFISYGSLGVDSDLFFNFQWKTFLKKNPLSNPKKIAKYLLFRVLFPAIGYVPFWIKRIDEESLQFIKKEYREVHQKTYRRYRHYRSRRNYQLALLYNYHLPERIEYWAVTGYKNGVVYRYPLLDKRIIEYMLKVPSKLLVKDSKYTRIILREISEGLLPEDVRWRLGKRDPAFFSVVYQQHKERGLLFIDEIDEFKANPDLYFIDFDLLEEEIKNFKENDDYPEDSRLFGDIVEFKALHEFSKSYQKVLEEGENSLSERMNE